MAKVITYNAGTNTITAKGGTELDPITFTDLYNADQAGGWGVCDYKGEGVFFMDCSLQVGDGYTSTYFKDVKKVVVWTSNIGAGYRNVVYIKSQVDFQLGEVSDVAKKQTYDACVFHVTRDNGVSRLFYGSATNSSRKIYGLTVVSENLSASTVWVYGYDDTVMWNCTFVNYVMPCIMGDTDIYRITLMGGTDISKVRAFETQVGNPDIDDFVASNVSRINMRAYTQSNFVKRLKATNENGVYSQYLNYDVILLDCELSVWTMYGRGVTKPGKYLRKYTVNINVADKDGANLSGVNVVCKDKDNNEVFSVNTDINGDIVEQEVVYQQWYQLTTGWHGEGDATTFSPHKFIVSKAGYETLEIDAITLSEPVKWHLELQDPAGPCDYPSEDDVEKDVVYDSGNKTGNFEAPAEAEVKKDVGYGSMGTEFLGILESDAILVGNNLEGTLEAKVNLRGSLQKEINMKGALQKQTNMVGSLEKKTIMIGTLHKTELVGEMK